VASAVVMYHLNRRFIDEKVLQQYYFEKFMTGEKDDRLMLLPNEAFFTKYAENNVFKVLHPEVKIRSKGPGLSKGFIVDFVLYPAKNKNEYVYIEMKYNLSSLNTPEAKKLRHPLLKKNTINGRESRGFVVVLVDDSTPKKPFPNDIPVVKLIFEDFAEWYLNNSIKMIDQLRAKLLPEHKPIRRRVPRNWVVYIGKKGKAQSNNYHNQALKKGVWAFQDSRNPKELLALEVFDRIIFVQFSGWKDGYQRKIIADGETDPEILRIKSSTSKNRGKLVDESQITFTIDQIDIFELTKGYYTDFKDDSFEKNPWKKLPNGNEKEKLEKASSKEFTQYVAFDKSHGTLWARGNAGIDRSEFKATDSEEKEFIDAARESANSTLPKEISDRCLTLIKDKIK